MTELKVMHSPVAVQAERPLCVDLDGTLVKSDTLVDSLMVLARRHPAAFLQTPLWVSKARHISSSRWPPWSLSTLPTCPTTVRCWIT